MFAAWLGSSSRWGAWFESVRFRRAAVGLLVVIAVAEGFVSIFRRETDFEWHRQVGAGFLRAAASAHNSNAPNQATAAEGSRISPYVNGGEWYPLARVMFDAPLALLPARAARTLCYLLTIGAYVAVWRVWSKLARRLRVGIAAETRADAQRDAAAECGRGLDLAAALGSGLLLLPLVLRDLDDCGLQWLLVYLVSAGAAALFAGRPTLSGFCLATAAVYKLTPILFLPLLLWFRQWRAAAAMTVCIVLWQLAPAALLGWSTTLDAHRQFLARTRQTLAQSEAYPHVEGVEEPKPHNQSFQAMLARYLTSVAPGHPIHFDHPAFVQFGRLADATAKRVMLGIQVALAAVLAWRFRSPVVAWWRRRRWAPGRTFDGDAAAAPAVDGDLVTAFAATCLLCALLSPLCWKQHLVTALPALFLSLRARLEQRRFSGPAIASLGFVLAAMWLTRHGLLGRELSVVLLSYKLITLAMFALLWLSLARPRGLSDMSEPARRDERPAIEPERAREAA